MSAYGKDMKHKMKDGKKLKQKAQRRLKFYSKTGDKCTLALTGETLPKTHMLVKILDSIDRLDAHIGLARDHILVSIKEKKRVELQPYAN